MKQLTDLSKKKKARVIELSGGHTFQQKLRLVGVIKGKTLEIIATQPFHGPVVVRIDDNEITLGREMAERILVEEAE